MTGHPDSDKLYDEVLTRLAIAREAVLGLRENIHFDVPQIEPIKKRDHLATGSIAETYVVLENGRENEVVREYAPADLVNWTLEEAAAMFAKSIWTTYDPLLIQTGLIPTTGFCNYSSPSNGEMFFQITSPRFNCTLMKAFDSEKKEKFEAESDQQKEQRRKKVIRYLPDISEKFALAHEIGYRALGDVINPKNILIRKKDNAIGWTDTETVTMDSRWVRHLGLENYKKLNTMKDGRHTGPFAPSRLLARDAHYADRADDIEAMGAVLLWAIGYQLPDTRVGNVFLDHRQKYVSRDLQRQAASLELPGISSIIWKACNSRYQSMRQLATELKEACQ